MKRLLIFLGLLAGAGSWAQEFTVHENGLIYSDHSVGKLKHIVDSLNLKFKVCKANKVYYAVPQAKVHYVELQDEKIKQARADMERGISFKDFVRKYKKAVTEQNLLVTRSEYTDYENTRFIVLSSLSFGDDYGREMDLRKGEEADQIKANLKGKWVLEHYSNVDLSDETLSAFYFLTDFESKPLPQSYARMVQYSDCLVDTTAQFFLKTASDTRRLFLADTVRDKIGDFLNYVHQTTHKPQFDYKSYRIDNNMTEEAQEKIHKEREVAYDIYYNALQKWDSTRMAKIDFLKMHDPSFDQLLQQAIDEAKDNKPTDDEFEWYVARYVSPELALHMKRNRRVIGGCSQDDGPRLHALSIAMLSAEATQWEVFLRAHLDIMNDRFDRMSDGSYAYGARQTYIKELEVLDINVPDLIFGISLRVGNPAENHYFGSIRRIGRALSESAQAKAMESSLLRMIADNGLDDYNRVLMYYLFDNYNYYLKDPKSKAQNRKKLKAVVAQMPAYLSSKIKVQEP
ncbi:hypothetical protein [Flavobacterium sp.]|uniref:hypothetical protein n=1 Tax=Flavobacterium sp. TaxID=239 RepID=UPI0039E714B4